MSVSVAFDALMSAVAELFNSKLGPEASYDVTLDRALRLLPRSQEPPRDVIYHLANFQTKEKLFRNSKDSFLAHIPMSHYFCLPGYPVTLQKQCALKPLLDMIRDNNFTYIWHHSMVL